MNYQKFIFPALGVALVGLAYTGYGWRGVALAAGALVMWVLIHLNRTMQVLGRAANRPLGYVESAVMFNARLKAGATLLQVIGMTRSLGQALSPADVQPEIFRWTDGAQSHVTCEFLDGKLVKWVLERPPQPAGDAEGG